MQLYVTFNTFSRLSRYRRSSPASAASLDTTSRSFPDVMYFIFRRNLGIRVVGRFNDCLPSWKRCRAESCSSIRSSATSAAQFSVSFLVFCSLTKLSTIRDALRIIFLRFLPPGGLASNRSASFLRSSSTSQLQTTTSFFLDVFNCPMAAASLMTRKKSLRDIPVRTPDLSCHSSS